MSNRSDSPRELLRDYLEIRFYIRLAVSLFWLVLLFIFLVYNFAIGNFGGLVIFFSVFFIIIFSITFLVLMFIFIKNARLKQKYLSSDCYKITKVPFKKTYRMPYYQYQFEVFDKLYSHHLGDMLFDTVLKEQIFDNSDISIDIILFHESGIYVVQTLALDGPLKGSADERIWTPHFYLGVKKTLSVDHTLLKSWKQANTLVNPIMQTDLHVKNLKKVLPKYEIKGVTILGEKMIDQSFSNMNNRLFSMDQFIEYVSSQPYLYSDYELKEAKTIIENTNRI